MKSVKKGTRDQWKTCLGGFLGEARPTAMRRSCRDIKAPKRREKCLRAADKAEMAQKQLEDILNGADKSTTQSRKG